MEGLANVKPLDLNRNSLLGKAMSVALQTKVYLHDDTASARWVANAKLMRESASEETSSNRFQISLVMINST